MSLYPKAVGELIKNLSSLPTIGRKNTRRLAYRIIDMDQKKVDELVESIVNVKANIRPYANCGNLTDKKLCDICSDQKRDSSTITAAGDSMNVISIEKTDEYNGKYHVLGGLLSPRDNISPQDLDLENLFLGCKKDYIKEVILVLLPTTNGDLTTNLIIEVLKNEEYNVKISRITMGVPLGVNLEYYDEVSLYKAILDRREIK